jgi:hypothetical protein
MKGYTLRKSGRKAKNRRVIVIIPEETTKLVMKLNDILQDEAETQILSYVARNPYVDCCGLSIEEDGTLNSDDMGESLSVPVILFK